MSNELVGRCWLIDFPSSAMQLVMMKLSDCADDDGANVFPSIAFISRETMLSRRSVSDQLAALRECGLVINRRDEARPSNRSSRTSVDREINIDLMAAVCDTRLRGKPRVPSSHVISQVEIDVAAGAERVLVPGALAWSVFAEPLTAEQAGRRKVWAVMPRGFEPAQSDAASAGDAEADETAYAAGAEADGEVPMQEVQGTSATDAHCLCTSCTQPLLDSSPRPSPPSPPQAVGRERKRDLSKIAAVDALLVDVVGSDGCPDRQRAVAVLIEPLARQRRIDAPDPRFSLTTIADWAAKHPDTVLKRARDRVLRKRDVTVKPSDIEAALKAEIEHAKSEARLARSPVIVTGTERFRRAIEAVRRIDPAEAAWLADRNTIKADDLVKLGIDPVTFERKDAA